MAGKKKSDAAKSKTGTPEGKIKITSPIIRDNKVIGEKTSFVSEDLYNEQKAIPSSERSDKWNYILGSKKAFSASDDALARENEELKARLAELEAGKE